jgi:hypothetical protein
MKTIALAAITLLATPSYAGSDEAANHSDMRSASSLSFVETPVIDVAKYINSKCKGYIEPLAVKKPDALISVNFETIGCECAAAIVRDFDSERVKT